MRLVAICLLLLARAALAETVQIPGPEGVSLRAELFRPAGPVVAPAVVALHGCGGPYPERDRMWSERLTSEGHVVLFPDSFGSRHLGSQCRVVQRLASSSGLRRQDAIAAAEWLAAQKEIPGGGVVVLGWSDGGSTVLATARAGRGLPEGLVRGFVAFYPGCRAAAEAKGWQPAASLLVLMGEADDWTPIAPCRKLAAAVGPAMTLVGYPGAYHDFDAPVPVRIRRNIPSSQNRDKTVHAGGDPAAGADATARALAWIGALPPAR